MHKKLQIFVSSTFLDLRHERQAAVSAILENGHIPAGMELFAAGDEEQMRVIRRWIDESDIFLLILGGRYGSLDPKSGKSYTHLEYEYAIDNQKPHFAIAMTDASREVRIKNGEPLGTLQDLEHADKLREFRSLVTSKLCKFADDDKDIKLGIWQSIRDLEQRHTFSGWVSSREVPDTTKTLADVAASAKHAADIDDKNRQLEARVRELEEEQLRRQAFEGWTFDELATALSKERIEITLTDSAKPLKMDLLTGLDRFGSILASGVTNAALGSKLQAPIYHKIASPLLVFGITERGKAPSNVHWQRLFLSKLGQRFLTELRVRGVRNQGGLSVGSETEPSGEVNNAIELPNVPNKKGTRRKPEPGSSPEPSEQG
jgi:hypothetical protein